MCGVVLTGHGGLDKLEYRDDLVTPVPGRDEALVAVAACGVNNTDVNTRTGWYSKSEPDAGDGADATENLGSWTGRIEFPLIQGADPVGRVVAIGDPSDTHLMGKRVVIDPWLRHHSGDLSKAGYLGSERDGGFAEYVVVPMGNAHPVDTDMSDVELATFACSFGTAEHMLDRARVRANQWVLVTGASGGVGNALIQLAKRRHAKVVALTRAEKISAVSGLGADVVLPRETDDLKGAVLDATGGVDVLADVVGGDLFPALFETIRVGGHYTTSGAIAGPLVRLDLRSLYLRDLTMHGATVVPPDVFAKVVSYIEREEVTPVVAATYPLTRLREAQEAFMAKSHVGAMVVAVST